MAKYIDAENTTELPWLREAFPLLENFYLIPKDIPATDVRPEILGRWITKYGGKPFCSYCGYNEGGAMQTSWKYCPNCGAMMDGKDGESE